MTKVINEYGIPTWSLVRPRIVRPRARWDQREDRRLSSGANSSPTTCTASSTNFHRSPFFSPERARKVRSMVSVPLEMVSVERTESSMSNLPSIHILFGVHVHRLIQHARLPSVTTADYKRSADSLDLAQRTHKASRCL